MVSTGGNWSLGNWALALIPLAATETPFRGGFRAERAASDKTWREGTRACRETKAEARGRERDRAGDADGVQAGPDLEGAGEPRRRASRDIFSPTAGGQEPGIMGSTGLCSPDGSQKGRFPALSSLTFFVNGCIAVTSAFALPEPSSVCVSVHPLFL